MPAMRSLGGFNGFVFYSMALRELFEIRIEVCGAMGQGYESGLHCCINKNKQHNHNAIT